MQKNRLFSSRLLLPCIVFSLLFSLSVASPAAAETVRAEANDGGGKSLDEVDSKHGLGAIPPQTFGWIEKVILSPELNWMLDAKLDTGADTSSLDAHKIKRVRYKDKSYVRFSIRNPETGEMVSLRRPYVRTVRIRRHNGNHQRRRVVLMTVCLGEVERTIEVTLTDREYFDYPMLLGRSALAGVAVVDPMSRHLTTPDCATGFGDNEDADDSVAHSENDDGVGTISALDDTEAASETTAAPLQESDEPVKRSSTAVDTVQSEVESSGDDTAATPSAMPGEVSSSGSQVPGDPVAPVQKTSTRGLRTRIDKPQTSASPEPRRALDAVAPDKPVDPRKSRLTRDNLTSRVTTGAINVCA